MHTIIHKSPTRITHTHSIYIYTAHICTHLLTWNLQALRYCLSAAHKALGPLGTHTPAQWPVKKHCLWALRQLSCRKGRKWTGLKSLAVGKQTTDVKTTLWHMYVCSLKSNVIHVYYKLITEHVNSFTAPFVTIISQHKMGTTVPRTVYTFTW